MSKTSYVYFIQDTKTLNYKIGVSVNPEARCRTLQTGSQNRLSLVAYMHGDRAQEAFIHRQLAEWRIAGEWFRRDSVNAYMRSLAPTRWVFRREMKRRHRQVKAKQRLVEAHRDVKSAAAKELWGDLAQLG